MKGTVFQKVRFGIHFSTLGVHYCTDIIPNADAFSKLTFICLENDLLADRYQAIILTNDGILLIVPFGKKFNEI